MIDAEPSSIVVTKHTKKRRKCTGVTVTTFGIESPSGQKQSNVRTYIISFHPNLTINRHSSTTIPVNCSTPDNFAYEVVLRS